MGKKLIIHSFLSRVIAVLSGVVMVVLTSRWLGAEVRGEISFLLSWIGAWVIVSDFVSGSGLINLSTKYPVKRLWRLALLWVLTTTLAAGFFHFLSPPAQSEYYWLIPVALLLMGIYNTQGALLIGKGKLNERNYSFAAVSFLSLLGFAALAWTKGVENLSLKDYFTCLLTAWLLAGIFTFLRLRKFFDKEKEVGEKQSVARTVFKTGLLVQTGHLVQYGAARAPFLVMPFLYGMETLGVYANTVILGEGVLIIAASLGQILHARVIRMNRSEEAAGDVLRYSRVSFLLILPTVLFLASLPDTFWVWLLKKEFAGLGELFRIFGFVTVFQSLASVISHFYHAAGRFKLLIVANLTGLIFGVAGFLTLSHFFGIKGFVAGVACGYFAQLLFLLFKFRQDFGISPFSFFPDRESFREVWGVVKKIGKTG